MTEPARHHDDVAGSTRGRVARHVPSAWMVSEWGVAEWFVVSQTLLPALLLMPGAQGLRFPIRLSTFLLPLGILVFTASSPNAGAARHPAQPWLFATLAYLALMVGHPLTNSPTGGAAQVGLYLCVISPLFWASSVVRTPDHFRRLAILLLVTNGLNATVGVLQVYDPDTWMPAELSRIVTQSRYGLGTVSYIGAEGQRIIRPPGLFDTPGAVAGPGMLAGLLGAVFAASPLPILYRVCAGGLAVVGGVAIYLSHVRTSLVLLVVILALYLVTLVSQRRLVGAAMFGAMLAAIVLGGLSFAVSLGGAEVRRRVMTLFETDPLELYYASRGSQIAYTYADALDSPFGSGLGRWGMVAHYFFDPSNLDSPPIWAEIQVAGWLIDGGFVVLGTYGLALLLATAYDWRITRTASNPRVRATGAVVFAANVGTVLLCLTYTPFLTGIGMQYWFLTGALRGVVAGARDHARDDP